MPNEKIPIKPGQLTDSTEIDILMNCILQRRITTRIYVTNCMIKNNIPGKKWWSIANSFLGKNTDSAVPPISDGKNVAYTNSEKATVFYILFLCNSELEDTNAEAPPYSHEPGPVLSIISATTHDVLDILKSFDTNKTTGADGISPEMLQEAAPSIAESLTKLINMSLDCKIFPKSWKLANVLPLFKKMKNVILGIIDPYLFLVVPVKSWSGLYTSISSILSEIISYWRPSSPALYQAIQPLTSCSIYIIYYVMHWTRKKNVLIVFCDISKALIEFGTRGSFISFTDLT